MARFTSLLNVLFATTVIAQGDLAALLQSQPDLSTFLGAVNAVPGLASTLSTATNITIFAPINSAFENLVTQDTPEAAAVRNRNSTTIQALLVRHVFNGYYPSSVITDTPAWIQSQLTPEYRNSEQPFANVTGGLYAGVVRNGADVNVISGELEVSNVTQADIRLGDGVIIHKVDNILAFGPPVTLFAVRARYERFQAVAEAAGIAQTIDIAVPDLTVFVPINEAFDAIGSIVEGADQSTLQSVLQYHVLESVVFSNSLGNMTVPTLEGPDLVVTILPDGQIFVNSAKVIFANVITGTGVAHVIDVVLNPNSAFDRSSLDSIASLPAESRVAFPNASPLPVTSLEATPTTISSADEIGEFTVSADLFYSTPTLLLTLNPLPAPQTATATPLPPNPTLIPTSSASAPVEFTGAAAKTLPTFACGAVLLAMVGLVGA